MIKVDDSCFIKDFILIGILYFYRFPYFLLIPYLFNNLIAGLRGNV